MGHTRPGPVTRGERAAIIVGGCVALIVIALTVARAAEPALEGAGFVVSETATVQPVVVEPAQWWSPLIGPFVAFMLAVLAVGTAFAWQLVTRLNTRDKVREAEKVETALKESDIVKMLRDIHTQAVTAATASQMQQKPAEPDAKPANEKDDLR